MQPNKNKVSTYETTNTKERIGGYHVLEVGNPISLLRMIVNGQLPENPSTEAISIPNTIIQVTQTMQERTSKLIKSSNWHAAATRCEH